MKRDKDGFFKPERESLSIYIDETGYICIKQWQVYSQEEPVIIHLWPEEVQEICQALITLAQEEQAALGV